VFLSHSPNTFLDERDATTLLTQALAEEIIRLSEAETDATTHIPGLWFGIYSAKLLLQKISIARTQQHVLGGR